MSFSYLNENYKDTLSFPCTIPIKESHGVQIMIVSEFEGVPPCTSISQQRACTVNAVEKVTCNHPKTILIPFVLRLMYSGKPDVAEA